MALTFILINTLENWFCSTSKVLSQEAWNLSSLLLEPKALQRMPFPLWSTLLPDNLKLATKMSECCLCGFQLSSTYIPSIPHREADWRTWPTGFECHTLIGYYHPAQTDSWQSYPLKSSVEHTGLYAQPTPDYTVLPWLQSPTWRELWRQWHHQHLDYKQPWQWFLSRSVAYYICHPILTNKELIIDLRIKEAKKHTPGCISRDVVMRVNNFRFLGITVTEKVLWSLDVSIPTRRA